MKLLQALTWSLLPLAALAAKKSPKVERFEKFHQKAFSSSPLKLNDREYEELTSAPRNYSVAVLFTAMEPQFGCQPCREFKPEWELLSTSWMKGDRSGESRMLFGTLDFADGKASFQKLQVQSVPFLLLFQPTVGPDAKPDGQPLRYEFGSNPSEVDAVHGWVSRHIPPGPRPPIVRPVNYTRIVVVSTIILGLLSVLRVAWPFFVPIIRNRNIWAAASLILILMFTSGHMFNHIRKVPYVVGDGKGGVSYFAGGFSNQFGLETQIVAAMYGVLSFATISLALKVPRIADPQKQRISIWVWSAIMLGMYSFLLSVFRVKNGGYPFWLPPF
ncbi:MAG: oligosaccharyl transferase subunit ost3/OST6 [Trichoglossum hirsutum]|nr:MAG: oligosaccharyl transferase subunit ost3/OST6 [Trichoglossum hirsutum]